MEKRIFNIETRVDSTEDGRDLVVGHASVYDSRSNNLGGFYEYIERVYSKEILVNEKMEIYVVVKGDCLSKIGREYGLKVSDIKEWNSLTSDDLSINDSLILYIPNEE